MQKMSAARPGVFICTPYSAGGSFPHLASCKEGEERCRWYADDISEPVLIIFLIFSDIDKN